MPVFPHASFQSLLDAVVRDLPVSAGIPPRLFPVVVPSVPFGDSLQLQIARRRGICMGLEFLMPQEFLQKVPGPASPGRDSDWSRRRLQWKLIPMVEPVAATLGVSNPSLRDQFALAGLLADQLDQYGHFRPRMIRQWAADMNFFPSNATPEAKAQEAWQRDLWAQVQSVIAEPHPALELPRVQSDETSMASLRDIFPKLLVIGTGTLDPLLIEVLAVMQSAGCEVSVHVLLPSMGFLGGLRRGALPDFQQDPESLEVSAGHPLLESMGRHAVGSFLLLGELDDQYTHWPEIGGEASNQSASLLRRLQDDIRSIRRPVSHACAPDGSITVHSCFGPRRELEVLRDEILRAFAEIDDLKPDEIHIVTPSLEVYAPLVAAVLAQGGQPLPVRITEVNASGQHPAAEALLVLMETVANEQFSASRLSEIVSLRAVLDALGVAEQSAATETMRRWIRDSGFMRDVPDAIVGTWSFAQDRLIAGRWFGCGGDVVYPDGSFVLPIADALRGDLDFRDRWICWMENLDRTLRLWRIPTAARQWSERIGDACDQLLSGSDDARLALQDVIQFLQSIPEDLVLDSGVIFDWLQTEILHDRRRTMVSGKITFGRFKQLQNLPCRVLAMVGMEEGAFPARNRTPSWDLLRMSPQVWDRNPRVDDRQLFLDAILTPSERLIITGSNRCVRTGKDGPMSPCVDELLRVAHQMGAGDEVMVKHRLQPFNSAYFDHAGNLPPSYDAVYASAARTLSASDRKHGIPFFNSAAVVEPTGAVEAISIDQLADFWRDPARGFLRSMGVVLSKDEQDDSVLDRAPMIPEGLEAWRVKNEILTAMLTGGRDLDHVHALACANRMLPSGALGRTIWSNLTETLEPIGAAAAALMGESREIDFVLDGTSCRIIGSVQMSKSGTHLVGIAASRKLSTKHALPAWIAALTASASGMPLPTWMIDEENAESPLELGAISQSDAVRSLAILIDGFRVGCHRPLHFSLSASDACAKALAKSSDPAKAIGAAEASWYEEGKFGARAGDGWQVSSRLAWRDIEPFTDHESWLFWAEAVSKPLRDWAKLK